MCDHITHYACTYHMCDQSGNTGSSQKWPKISKKCHFAMVISTTFRIQLCYLVKVAIFFHKNSRKNGHIFPKSATFPKLKSGFTAKPMDRICSNFDTKFVTHSCKSGQNPQQKEKMQKCAFLLKSASICLMLGNRNP